MILISAIVISVVMSLFMLAQTVLVIGFYFRMTKGENTQKRVKNEAKAGVALCLRGSDPFLEDCLNALFSLNYSNFEVLVLIDSENDPARPVAERILGENPSANATIEFLRKKHDTCSLKCSSLAQAVETLASKCDFFVQLDADTVVHPNWLNELAAALEPSNVAVATGNRWYAPANRSIGALVRYVWNAGAIVQMYWYAIPWGGSLAIKTSLFRETEVLKQWKTAFCEDTMLFEVCRLAGYKVAFAPTLLMLNREDCGLLDFFGWVTRQLVTARLYHPAWLAVCSHGLGTTVSPLLGIILLTIAALIGDWPTVWLLAAVEIGYQIINVLLVFIIELAAAAAIGKRNTNDYQTSFATLVGGWLMLPLTQFVYGSATIAALFARKLTWRGIDYEVNGPFNIRMVEYKPYRPLESENTQSSL